MEVTDNNKKHVSDIAYLMNTRSQMSRHFDLYFYYGRTTPMTLLIYFIIYTFNESCHGSYIIHWLFRISNTNNSGSDTNNLTTVYSVYVFLFMMY